jgi:hypothetical protein
MTSTPTTEVLGLRKQGLGDNVNTWGDTLLNINFDTIARLVKGFQDVTVTGDTTVSEANYSSSNQTAVPLIRLGGSPSAAFSYVVPSRPNFFVLWNNSGQTATVKLAASSGFALPASRTALVATDGATDVYNVTPNYLADIVETNNRDVVDYGALNTAIANASSTITNPGSVRISASDTTAGFLAQKLTVSGSLTSSTVGAGGNETINLNVTVPTIPTLNLTLQADQSTAFSSTSGSIYPVDCTSSTITVTLPTPTGGFGITGFIKRGLYPIVLSGIVNGSTNITLEDEQTLLITDSSTNRGWV